MNVHVGSAGPKTHRWTEAELELAKARWLEGKTGDAIAAELGQGITRNAVIGRVHRLKIGSHGSNPTKGKPKVKPSKEAAVRVEKTTGKTGGAAGAILRRTAAKVEKPAQALSPFKLQPFRAGTPINTVVDDGPLIPLLALTEHTCKWPSGDPLLPGFGFCGRPSLEGKPYCARHQRRAYFAS